MSIRRVLVTGSTGFVGRRVVEQLQVSGKFEVVIGLRSHASPVPLGVEALVLGPLEDPLANVSLSNIDSVIHCAARVHVMDEDSRDPITDFRIANVKGTVALARRAAEAGVKRFIFLSSIKVNGESTDGRRPFTADDVPQPSDPYGISKHEAELALRELASETGMQVVIIRPVLVYGPGVKANFQSMMKWLRKGIPLPFGLVRNKRSMVALDNLVGLIMICVDHPAAANETFLVSDGEDLSTPELLRRTAKALGVKALLLPVPAPLLRAVAILAGKTTLSQRLCGSLQVDIAKTKRVLSWSPLVSVDQALDKTARHFQERY